MVLQRILARQFSNLDDEGVFQAKLYKNIDRNNAKGIIAATNCTNRAMHNISTLLNCLSIHFFKVIILIRISQRLSIPTEGVKVSSLLLSLYYAPVIIHIA